MNVLHRLGDMFRSGAALRTQPLTNEALLVRAIIDSINDAILVVDADRRIVLANPAACRLFGYAREDLQGRTTEMLYPDRQAFDQAAETFYASVREGSRMLVGFTFRRRDNSLFDGEILGAVLRDLQGTAIGFLATIRDITERNRLEAALRKSEQRYHDLVSVIETHHLIYTHDAKGNFTYLSSSVTDILGYSPEEFMTHYTEYMTDDPANAGAVKRTERSIRGEQQPAYLVQVFHKNGERRWLEIVETPLRGPDGSVIAVHGIARDITEHRQSEMLLAESEARFRSLFESAPIGMHMYRLHPDGRLVFTTANPAAERILGVDHRAFVGKTIEEAFPPLRETEIPDRYRAAAAAGTPWRSDNVDYENGIIRGAYEVVAFQTSPDTMVAAFTDITERKKREEELRRLNAKLQAAAEKVRMLKGLLPICAYCKRIKDDTGTWEYLESYITKRSQAEFTHGICPDCVSKYFPGGKFTKTPRKEPDKP